MDGMTPSTNPLHFRLEAAKVRKPKRKAKGRARNRGLSTDWSRT